MASTATKSERLTGILQDVSAKSKTASTWTESQVAQGQLWRQWNVLVYTRMHARTNARSLARMFAHREPRPSHAIIQLARTVSLAIALSCTHKLSQNYPKLQILQNNIFSTKMSKHTYIQSRIICKLNFRRRKIIMNLFFGYIQINFNRRWWCLLIEIKLLNIINIIIKL